MISEHAMLVILLLLAIAVVILAVGQMVYAKKMDMQLKRMADRVEEMDAVLCKTGAAE